MDDLLAGSGMGFARPAELNQFPGPKHVLELASWKVSGPDGAAELLGLKPTTPASKMKALGIKNPG